MLSYLEFSSVLKSDISRSNNCSSNKSLYPVFGLLIKRTAKTQTSDFCISRIAKGGGVKVLIIYLKFQIVSQVA